MDDQSDEQLMLEYAAGKTAAFELLYQRHRGPLYRYILRQVHEPATANDLYQGSWEKIILGRHSYRAAAPFRAWMYTIARNHLLDYFRRHHPVAEREADDLEDTAAGPEQNAVMLEQQARLAAAIAGLPQVQKETLLLKLEAGLDLRNIAAVTGVNEETAKSRLRYALAKLQPLLQAEAERTAGRHG